MNLYNRFFSIKKSKILILYWKNLLHFSNRMNFF